jgi:hypothetical protein
MATPPKTKLLGHKVLGKMLEKTPASKASCLCGIANGGATNLPLGSAMVNQWFMEAVENESRSRHGN